MGEEEKVSAVVGLLWFRLLLFAPLKETATVGPTVCPSVCPPISWSIHECGVDPRVHTWKSRRCISLNLTGDRLYMAETQEKPKRHKRHKRHKRQETRETRDVRETEAFSWKVSTEQHYDCLLVTLEKVKMTS